MINRQTDAALDFQRFGEKFFLQFKWPPILAAVNRDLQRFDAASFFHLRAKRCEMIGRRCAVGDDHRHKFKIVLFQQAQKFRQLIVRQHLRFNGNVAGFGNATDFFSQRAFHSPEAFDEFEFHRIFPLRSRGTDISASNVVGFATPDGDALFGGDYLRVNWFVMKLQRAAAC